ncbi:MAG: hypothetical protein WC325_11870, partial [Candidatus Bathyarchaeia archaeon]
MSTRSHRSPLFNSSRKQFLKAFGKKIEEYDSIKRAVEAVGEISKSNYYRELPNYFLFLNENPDSVIKNRRAHLASDNPEDEDYYERKTKAYVNVLKDKGLAGRGIQGIVGRIGGFYSNNSKRYSLDLGNLRIPKARKVVKYSPVNDEVRELQGFADQRGKVIVCLAYQNGAAPVDISELCCGDLPLEPFSYFEKARSKTGEVWRGVTTPDLVVELKAYLKQRGSFGPKDLLFKSREGYLDNDGVSRVINDLIDRAGFGGVVGFKPTSLRDAFEDALVDANVNSKVKEALMAHTSDIQHQYGSDKKMKERMVEAIKKAYPLICLNDANKNSVLA